MSIDYVFMRNGEYLGAERGWTADLDEALVINTTHPYRLMSLIRMRMAIVPKPIVDGERVVYLYGGLVVLRAYKESEYPRNDFDELWPTYTPVYARWLDDEARLPMEGDADPMAFDEFSALFEGRYEEGFLKKCFDAMYERKEHWSWTVDSIKEFVELEGK